MYSNATTSVSLDPFYNFFPSYNPSMVHLNSANIVLDDIYDRPMTDELPLYFNNYSLPVSQPFYSMQPSSYQMRPMPLPLGPPSHPIANNFLESRISDMNKRLYMWITSSFPEKDHAQWWDAFGIEFFDDDAKMTMAFNLEDGPKRYTIGRTLIPRFFRSIFESGVKELYYLLRNPVNELWQTNMNGLLVPILDADNVLIFSKHQDKQDHICAAEVQTEGRLICEFSLFDPMNDPLNAPRIRNWTLEIRGHQEFIPRSLLANFDKESVSKNITRNGLTSLTLNYLRLCVILEPMQQLMSHHKQFPHFPPKECLRRALFNRYAQRSPSQISIGATPMPAHQMGPPLAATDEPARPAPKRKRSRKGSQSAAGGGAASASTKKKNITSPAPTASNFPLTSQVDVMVVGEPSMMGGEYGEEDERLISRIENAQFDPHTHLQAMPASGVWPSSVGSLLARPSSSGTPSSRMGTPMSSSANQPPSIAAEHHQQQQQRKTSETQIKRDVMTPEAAASSANGQRHTATPN